MAIAPGDVVRAPRPRVPEYQPNETQHRRQLARSLNLVIAGQLDCTLSVTLTPSSATTGVTDARISVQTAAIPVPVTASAASEIAAGTMFMSVANGSMTITHANSAVTDRIFTFAFIG
jgi:hypothetical protein